MDMAVIAAAVSRFVQNLLKRLYLVVQITLYGQVVLALEVAVELSFRFSLTRVGKRVWRLLR